MSLRYKGAVLSTTSPTSSVTAAVGLWTLDQQLQAQNGTGWPVPPPPRDPYFYDVSLLLNGDSGSNGAQNNTFLDSSANNFTITRNGNTSQGSVSPYGSLWSNYFGGSGDYLSVPDNAAFDFGTGNFTIECWVYHTTASGVAMYAEHPSGGVGFYRDGSNRLSLAQANVANLATSSTALPAYQWVHIAASRSGTSLKLFINGVQAASVSDSTNFTSTSAFNIGVGSGYYMTGYISNLRVVKGTALYTTGFTPSTTPLTAVSGTSLLTCQSNRFIDNSSNNFTLTVNGTPSVQRFSPFNPTAPYSASTIGGSAYFDGTGDYLTFPNNSAFAFGTGAFTIEFWINGPSSNDKFILGGRKAIGTMFITTGGYNSTTVGALRYVGSSTIVSSNVVTDNTWHHCAIVRDGSNNVTLYVDGVSRGTGTDTTNYTTASGTWYVARHDLLDSNYLTGYLSDFRIVKGTAVYTSNFTPPAAPVTAVSGTSILTNFTNAGIPDAAMQNNLETTGTAQVSTSVFKYGTGSLYFNGSSSLVGPTNNTLAFGTGDFTIEAWVYNTSAITTEELIISLRAAGNGLWFGTTAGGFYTYPIGGSQGSVPKNTWVHLAASRQSGTFRKFINGVQTYTGTHTNNFDSYTPLVGGGDYYWTGYIDDLRVTIGYARYTANFTPPDKLPTY